MNNINPINMAIEMVLARVYMCQTLFILREARAKCVEKGENLFKTSQ